MIIDHALKYLKQAKYYAILMQCSEYNALNAFNPSKPCAAFGEAKRMLRLCGSVDKATTRIKRRIR